RSAGWGRRSARHGGGWPSGQAVVAVGMTGIRWSRPKTTSRWPTNFLATPKRRH
ncbi:hypothetical protein T484DRAFT_1971114, partial [Baffinella frigidus]